MNAAPLTATVLDVIPETPDIQTLRLDIKLPFKAGQSVTLKVAGDPKKRFYSISSSPTEKDWIAITIKAEPERMPLYDTVFKLNKGVSVELGGPYGAMCLPDTPNP